MCIELSAKIVPRVSLIQLHPKNSIDSDFGMQIASEMDRVTAEDRYEDMAQRVSYSGYDSSHAVNTASIRFGRVFAIPSAIGNSVTHALVAVLFHSFLSPIVCCSSTRSTCVRVCVSLLIRSVQRYSIERFVVHSFNVLMTQELKSSIICCPFRYRLIGVVLPYLDYRCRQCCSCQVLYGKWQEAPSGVLQKKEKRRKEE